MRDSTSTETLLSGQNRALELIAGDASLQEILDYLVHFIESHGEGIAASVLLLEGDRLVLGAAPSLPDEYNRGIDGVRIGPRVGSCGTAAYENRPIIVEDIATDPLWSEYKALALSHGLRACWSTPISSRKGAVLGTFAIYHRSPGRPDDAHLQLVQLATHLAGVAIERHRADAALRQRTEALLAADRRKDELIAMLAHELRNPLAPIVTSLELMKRKGKNPGAVEKYRDIVERQVHILVRLVDDLLEISRVTRGKISLAVTRIAVRDALATALEATRPHLESRFHELVVDLPARPIVLQADPVRFAQVLSNVLNNAYKYTEPGGLITIKVEQQGSDAVIRVKDSGIGIAPDMLPRIFELFTQVDVSLARSQGGLGIGLTLVKQLVELHGGTVTARSEGLGKGTEVEIRLPSDPSADPETAPLTPAPEDGVNHVSRTVSRCSR
ncbi:MAG: GAF domain-containing sensor histidine kinase [Polyangiaceae bacterium]